jgi:tRNA A37 threonylcarbamoyladenosine modification protein TsaB
VGSLDILAAAARDAAGPDPGDGPPTVVSVVDARRGEVFAAAYPFAGDAPAGADPATVRQDRPEPLGPDALEAWLVELSAAHGRVTVVGDGAVRYHEQLVAHPGLDLGRATELSAPPPLAQARLARSRLDRGQVPAPAADLVPDYRRPPDARINWEQRAPRSAPVVPGGPR